VEPYIDLHTHNYKSGKGVLAVYNLSLNEALFSAEGPFSAGLHPWYADQLSPELLSQKLELLATNHQLVAFGESGLDKVCHVPLEVQKDIFEIHLRKAAENNKPLILHCVKAWEELLEMTSIYPLPKILHGYNGSQELTGRLVKAGFYFSIGKSIMNPASKIRGSMAGIPMDAIFCETDTSDFAIDAIYRAVSEVLHLNEVDLRKIIFRNYSRITENNIAG
jgi:TatD DNase family protein